ncbi:TetR/AcrR family transcriptional regulator [Agromyces aureus]|uniref:TetR/AcrR family transcriptional regulator n=1 Tax=Agromyces aureus TaxID=453304 RepID=UPI0013747733|nr:TetR/AcrR family transcriptional regulator [Agromyces aureus]
MSEHRRGPVRSEAARIAILEATARLFETRGYDQLTMEGIAAEAHVGKQTIYRWWPSKSAVVADCMVEGLLLREYMSPPDTGDLRVDLTAWVDGILTFLEHGGASLVKSLVAAAIDQPSIGDRLGEALGINHLLNARLESAIDAGQFSPTRPTQSFARALVGAIVLLALADGPAEPGAAGQLVDAVLG